MEVVVNMTEDDVKDCDVRKKGHLRKFMQCIRQLKEKRKGKESVIEEEFVDQPEEGMVTPYIAR